MVVCLEKLLELFASLSAPCTIFFSFVVFSLQDLFVKYYRGVQSVLNVSFVLCYVPGGGDLLKPINALASLKGLIFRFRIPAFKKA